MKLTYLLLNSKKSFQLVDALVVVKMEFFVHYFMPNTALLDQLLFSFSIKSEYFILNLDTLLYHINKNFTADHRIHTQCLQHQLSTESRTDYMSNKTEKLLLLISMSSIYQPK